MDKAKTKRRSGKSGKTSVWDVINRHVIQAIRLSWIRYSPDRKEALLNAKVTMPFIKKDGTYGEDRNFYTCASCLILHPVKEVQVDHITPLGTHPRFLPTPDMRCLEWISNLYCKSDDLQILCKDCHKEKTRLERKARACLKNSMGQVDNLDLYK